MIAHSIVFTALASPSRARVRAARALANAVTRIFAELPRPPSLPDATRTGPIATPSMVFLIVKSDSMPISTTTVNRFCRDSLLFVSRSVIWAIWDECGGAGGETMKNIGLVMCGCLLWTSMVSAQSPLLRIPGSASVSRAALEKPASLRLRSVFADRNDNSSADPIRQVSHDSSSAPIHAGYQEYDQSPYQDAGVQHGEQPADLCPPGQDPFYADTNSEWVDVSGLDLHGVLPYYSNLHYGQGSVKDSGHVVGFYGYASTTFDLVEVGIESTAIDFRSGFQYHQEDYTFVWNNYSIKNFRWRAGVHYINSNSAPIDGGIIGILGAHFIQDRWEAGSDFYVSNYQNFAPALTVTEVSPHIAFPYGPAKGELRGYYIHVDRDLGLGQRDFLSIEARMSQDFGKFNVGGYGWGGEQTFAVRNDGFLVYNLTEKHRAGYGVEVGYKFTDHTKITGRGGQELFSDFNTQSKTYQTFLSLLLLHTF